MENQAHQEQAAQETGVERESAREAVNAAEEQDDHVAGGAVDFGALELDADTHPAWLRKMLDDDTFENKVSTQLWTSRLTYILAAVGSAVGLGNIWRFPFLCYRNGGATFLVPYILSLFFLGIPLLVLEMSIGQGTGKGAVGTFASFSPRYKGLGWCCFVSGAGIVTYYCVVLAWCSRYLVASVSGLFANRLPWAAGKASQYFQSTVMQKVFSCSTASAAKLDVPALECDASIPMSYEEMISVTDLASEDNQLPCVCVGAEFEHQGALQGVNVGYLVGVWAVVLLMCFLGTRSLKWAVYVTVPLPYLMLVLIFIRGVTLDGAAKGLEYYLQPDWNRLFNDYTENGVTYSAANVWLDAATQIFFSLSLGQGAMITYASYNPPHFPVVRNAVTVALINSCTEFFAGMCVFSILGYLSEARGVPIEEVVDKGPGLVFEVIPEALSLMPAAGLFSIMFFVMLLMLGLTSAVSLVEGCISILRDFFQGEGAQRSVVLRKPWLLPVVMCVSCCLMGLLFCRSSASDWVDLIDEFTSNMLLTTVGLGEFLVVGWAIGGREFAVLMQQRLQWDVTPFWHVAWKLVGPAALGVLMLAGWSATVNNPPVSEPWALAIGWLMAGIPLSVAVAIYLTALDHEGNGFSFAGAWRSCVAAARAAGSAFKGGRADKELLHRSAAYADGAYHSRRKTEDPTAVPVSP